MRNLALEFNFNDRFKTISFKELLLEIISGKMSLLSQKFKLILKDLLYSLEFDLEGIESIKAMELPELINAYNNIKRFNNFFDKMHDKYNSVNYFKDAELKGLFKSVSRRAHTIENICHKNICKHNQPVVTPDYIKMGLAKLSQEALYTKFSTE